MKQRPPKGYQIDPTQSWMKHSQQVSTANQSKIVNKHQNKNNNKNESGSNRNVIYAKKNFIKLLSFLIRLHYKLCPAENFQNQILIRGNCPILQPEKKWEICGIKSLSNTVWRMILFWGNNNKNFSNFCERIIHNYYLPNISFHFQTE